MQGTVRTGTINLIDMNNIEPEDITYGRVSRKAGAAPYEYIEHSIKLALAGEVDAVVTGPINKEALNLAGYRYSGHTEIFATLTGVRDYCMMLADGDFRVSHVTTHVSLRKGLRPGQARPDPHRHPAHPTPCCAWPYRVLIEWPASIPTPEKVACSGPRRSTR